MDWLFSFENIINFFAIAVGIGVCGMCLLQIKKAPIRNQIRKLILVFLWLVIVYVSMYLVRLLLDGRPGEAVRIVMHTTAFIEFLMSGLMTAMMVIMIWFTAFPSGRPGRAIRADLLFTALHIVLLIAAQFTHLYYYFDENNVYHRSGRYIISNLAPVLMMALAACLLIRYRQRIERRLKAAFWIYLLVPLAAIVVQAFYSDIKFILIATIGASIYMFAVITGTLTEKYENQQKETSRIEAELSMATRIQADMLPNIFPAFPDRKEFDIYASMSPAKEVGGDFYDFFLIDDDHLGIVMADVSGKGVPAALFMMASKIVIQNYTVMNTSPKTALETANDHICQNNREEMFVTVWLGILEISSGILRAVNAGHEYPILKEPGGEYRLFKDKHGFVVGGMEGTKYPEYEIRLEKGSMLFLYTDGVVEATNADEVLFGTDRLLLALNGSESDVSKNTVEHVGRAVDAFVKEAPRFDDLTMLCIRYNGTGYETEPECGGEGE